MAAWTNYFTVTGSIASGLTGLIFIGLLLNIRKIFSITKEHWPKRAAGSLILITNIVIVCNLCLLPGQPLPYLGSEISILAAVICFTISTLDIKLYRSAELPYKKLYVRNLFFLQLSIIPFLAAGILLIFGIEAAYFVLVPGIIFSLVKSLLDIWFFMVGINNINK
jgi:hypothetical protein